MNPELAKALGEIERGAERCLREKQEKIERMQEDMGNKQVVIGHIEKKEEPEVEEIAESVPAKKAEEQDDTTMEEEQPTGPPRRHTTLSVTALKQTLAQAKLREQQRRYCEAMKWRHATDEALGDVDWRKRWKRQKKKPWQQQQ